MSESVTFMRFVLGQLLHRKNVDSEFINCLISTHEPMFVCNRNANRFVEAIELIHTLPAHESSIINSSLLEIVSSPRPPEESRGMRLTAV